MKTVKFIILLLLITVAGNSQSPFKGFWKPVSKDIQAFDIAKPGGQLLFRPAAGVLATRHTYYKETKEWVTSPLSAVGVGIGLEHFTQLPNGEPFNDIGVNLLLLTDTKDASMGLGLFGTFFGWVNLGADYQFSIKKFSIDTGVTIRF